MENSHILDQPRVSTRVVFRCRNCRHAISAWEDMEGGLCEGCEVAAYIEIIDVNEVAQ
jgi:hypothetical protein